MRSRAFPGLTWQRVLLIVGVLGLGLAFIFSYVGAFHDPRPHSVSIAVVAPESAAGSVIGDLNGLAGRPLEARAASDATTAEQQVRTGEVVSALVVNRHGRQDRLLVATGGGAALATSVEAVVKAVDVRQHRTVSVVDLVPLQSGDYHGLTGFYVVVGWLVSGYLLAAILGLTGGSRVTGLADVGRRVLGLIPYAAVAGLGGALIVGTVLGAQTGHFLALAGIGALLVYAAATTTLALEEIFGIVGIGLAILLFVVLGNPSAGGAYQIPLLPGFWRTIGPLIPNGAGVEALRRIVYFGSHGIGWHLILIIAYCVVAIVVMVVTATVRGRRPNVPDAA